MSDDRMMGFQWGTLFGLTVAASYGIAAWFILFSALSVYLCWSFGRPHR